MTLEGFDFFRLAFDNDGQLEAARELDGLITHARTAPATDAVLIAHGFRNNAQDAEALYARFLKSFRSHFQRPDWTGISSRRFVVAGVFWPSKPFREIDDAAPVTRGIDPDGSRAALEQAHDRLEALKASDATPSQRRKLDKAIALLPTLDGDHAKQDEFVSLVLALIDDSRSDPTEGVPQVKAQPGSEILAKLGAPSHHASRGLGDVVDNIGGAVGRFLNLTMWYVMKDRSGVVGATGVAAAVRDLHAACPALRIHLVGHSLGGRLMASCAKALSDPPVYHPDSLLLLEGAFSHFGFSPDNGHRQAGFFRDVVTRKVIKGPFLSTFSAQDSVVANAYSIMSRLAGDNTRAIGDASDEFGGIGRNGPLKTPEVSSIRLQAAGATYDYKPGVINSLDGSGGLIKDHGDVANDAITYAFGTAVART